MNSSCRKTSCSESLTFKFLLEFTDPRKTVICIMPSGRYAIKQHCAIRGIGDSQIHSQKKPQIATPRSRGSRNCRSHAGQYFQAKTREINGATNCGQSLRRFVKKKENYRRSQFVAIAENEFAKNGKCCLPVGFLLCSSPQFT